MKKIISLMLMVVIVAFAAVSCNYDPDDDAWVSDEGYTPAGGTEDFTINVTNVMVSGVAVTGDIQIYSNIADANWGTHPIFAVTAGTGTYTNSSIEQSKAKKYQIAALFVTSNASAAWGDASMVDNSHTDAGNWVLYHHGFHYDWDLSDTTGPEEITILSTIVK